MEIDTPGLETGISDMEISIPGLAERTPVNEISNKYLEMKTADVSKANLNVEKAIGNYEF